MEIKLKLEELKQKLADANDRRRVVTYDELFIEIIEVMNELNKKVDGVGNF